jgi:hypothetical protein
MRLVRLSQSRALLAPQKTRQGGHCLMAKMPYVALISQGTPNQKYLKMTDNGSRCGSRFAFWGDLDRQRRRRVRFVQGS